jgi:hypothetical protein
MVAQSTRRINRSDHLSMDGGGPPSLSELADESRDRLNDFDNEQDDETRDNEAREPHEGGRVRGIRFHGNRGSFDDLMPALGRRSLVFAM